MVGVGLGVGVGVGVGLGVIFGWTGWCPPVQKKNTISPKGCYIYSPLGIRD